MKHITQYIKENKEETPTKKLFNALVSNGHEIKFKSSIDTEYGVATGAHVEGRSMYIDMKPNTAYELMIPFTKFGKKDKVAIVSEI